MSGVNCNHGPTELDRLRMQREANREPAINFEDLAEGAQDLSFGQLADAIQSFDQNDEAGLQKEEFAEFVSAVAPNINEETQEKLFNTLRDDDDSVSTGEILDAAETFDTDQYQGWAEEEFNEFISSLSDTPEEFNEPDRYNPEKKYSSPYDDTDGARPAARGGRAPEMGSVEAEGFGTDDGIVTFDDIAGEDESLSTGELFDTLVSLDQDQSGSLDSEEFSDLYATLGLDEQQAGIAFEALGGGEDSLALGDVLDVALNEADSDIDNRWSRDEFNSFAAFLNGEGAHV